MLKTFPLCKMFISLPTEKMDTKEKEILIKAAEIFTRNGIKSMNMDDISRHIGISKKTLYQYFSNKKDLVKKSVELHIKTEQACMREALCEDINPIDELMLMTRMVSSQVKEMHPSIIFDLRKYHPEAYKCLAEHRNLFVYSNIKNNIEKGVKTGLYRENINSEILTRLYLAMMNVILDPESNALSDFNYIEIYKEMIRYHIKGIASEKGREYLNQKFNIEHNS